MLFKPCISRNACSEDDSGCRTCGRSHDEIMRTRRHINSLSDFISEMNYENSDEFLQYFVKKVKKKLNKCS